MTLNDIIIASLTQLDRGHDAQTLDVWRDKLTRFADEAIADLALVIKPKRTDNVTVKHGVFSVNTLPRQCIKILSVSKDGNPVSFKEGNFSEEILVPSLANSEHENASVTYIYIPGTLESGTDEPEIPKRYHSLIVCYVIARERGSGEVSLQRGSNIYFEMYEAGKRSIRPHFGGKDNYKLLNRW